MREVRFVFFSGTYYSTLNKVSLLLLKASWPFSPSKTYLLSIPLLVLQMFYLKYIYIEFKHELYFMTL